MNAKTLKCRLGFHDWEEYHYTEYPTLHICRRCGTWSKESRKAFRDIPLPSYKSKQGM